MQLVLEKRAERSTMIAIASPLIAIALTLVTVAILFAIIGKNPIAALDVYFIDPLTDPFSLQEIAVKATPLVMIAVGLRSVTSPISGISAPKGSLSSARCAAAGSPCHQRHRCRDWVLPAC